MSEFVDLKGLSKWLKTIKGISKIDMMELQKYVPEYNEWLKKQ